MCYDSLYNTCLPNQMTIRELLPLHGHSLNCDTLHRRRYIQMCERHLQENEQTKTKFLSIGDITQLKKPNH